MKSFIFLTNEGNTYQPGSKSIEPDIENMQVIGIANGSNSDDAFKNLTIENNYLFKTRFNDIFSYELSPNYDRISKHYYLQSQLD